MRWALALVVLTGCYRYPDGVIEMFGYRPAELAGALDYNKILVLDRPTPEAEVQAAISRHGAVLSTCAPLPPGCDNETMYLVETPHGSRRYWEFDPLQEPEFADQSPVLRLPDPDFACSCYEWYFEL